MRRTGDPRSVELLDIFRNDTKVGVLRRTARGARFELDARLARDNAGLPGGLALHLPWSKPVVETQGVNLPPYFAGLLPEGLRLKALVSRAATSEDDLFTLLVAAGSDCVGDLFPVLPGGAPHLDEEGEEQRPLDGVNFEELFRESLERAQHPVVAGVQAKLSPGVVSFPFATSGRRWILKLNPPELERVVENEHFFMEMAAACGLAVATTRLVHDRDGAAGLLVERFDRRRDGRRWVGVHQEDLCQVLDLYPADKYRLKSAQLAQAIEGCPSPPLELLRLLEQFAFSYLVGNGDLHAKNLSLSSRSGVLQVSPAYDVLCTRPYQDLTLALEFEGRRDNVKRKHLVDFAARHRVPPSALEARLDHLLVRARPFFSRLHELGFDARRTKQMGELLKKRHADLSASKYRAVE